MKKQLLTAAFFVGAWSAYSQVGVGTLTPNNSSQLDVVSSNKGVLLPRVGLISSTDNITITQGNVNSLLVYNVNKQNDVAPGFYYWYADKWMRIMNQDEILALDKDTKNAALSYSNGNLVLTDTSGNTVSVPLADINITTDMVYDPNTGIVSYTNESGNVQSVDLSAVIGNFETVTSVAVDASTGILTYVDEAGASTAVNIVTNATNVINPGNLTAADTSVNVINGIGATLKNSSVRVADGGISNVKLAVDAVSESKIQDGAVTSSKILNGTIQDIDLADNAISTNKIQNDAITAAKINPNVAGEGLAQDANGALIVDKTAIAGDLVTDGGIEFYDATNGTDKLLADAKIRIADGGVTNAKIAEGAVSQNKLTSFTANNGTNTPAAAGQVPVANGLGGVIYNNVASGSVTYVNTTSGLTATDAQKAIDELAGNMENLELAGDVTGRLGNTVVTAIQGTDISTTKPTLSGQTLVYNNSTEQWEPSALGAENVAYDNTTSGITANNVKGAIDELANRKEDLTTDGKIVIGDNTSTTTAQSDAVLVATRLSIKANSLTADEIASGAIGSDELGTSVVTADKIAPATITPDKLNAGSGNGTKVLRVKNDGSEVIYDVVRAKDVVYNGATSGLNADNAEDAINELANTVNGLADGDITSTDLTVTGGVHATFTDVSLAIKDGAVTTGKLAPNTVTAAKINADVAGAGLTQSTNGALAVAHGTAGQVMVTNAAGTGVTWVNQSAIVPEGQDLTPALNAAGDVGSETIEVTGGTGATLVDSSVRVKAESITTAHIKNGTVIADDLALVTGNNGSGTIIPLPNQTLITNTTGKPEWKNAAPRFFYMPAVIFDTSMAGTGLKRNLYQDYVNQFTGGQPGAGNAAYPISAGAAGTTPMQYTGGLVGSQGAPADIAVFQSNQLYYYVTYYDQNVFENLSIDANGILTYSIKAGASATSYMNIVFVIN